MHETNKVTYQPEANFVGSDSFTFSISRNGSETNGTAFLTVGDPNDGNHTDPGSGGGDYNGTEGLPVYALGRPGYQHDRRRIGWCW